MNDHGPSGRADEPDVDPGPPIAELEGLREPAPDELLGSVVRSVERRVLASYGFDLPWFGFGRIFREYWAVALAFFAGRGGTKGDS